MNQQTSSSPVPAPTAPAKEPPAKTTFTDAAGVTWSLALTVTAVKRVRELVGVDLGRFFGQGPAAERTREQLSDVVTVANVLFAIVKPQADQKGITDEQFGEALSGDVIAEASELLLEGLLSFQPSREGRAALRQVIEARRRLGLAQLNEAVTKLTAASGESSTSVPASSASTPAPSPSES